MAEPTHEEVARIKLLEEREAYERAQVRLEITQNALHDALLAGSELLGMRGRVLSVLGKADTRRVQIEAHAAAAKADLDAAEEDVLEHLARVEAAEAHLHKAIEHDRVARDEQLHIVERWAVEGRSPVHMKAMTLVARRLQLQRRRAKLEVALQAGIGLHAAASLMSRNLAVHAMRRPMGGKLEETGPIEQTVGQLFYGISDRSKILAGLSQRLDRFEKAAADVSLYIQFDMFELALDTGVGIAGRSAGDLRSSLRLLTLEVDVHVDQLMAYRVELEQQLRGTEGKMLALVQTQSVASESSGV